MRVDDLSLASVFALEHWQPTINEQIFLNIGTGIKTSIKELADTITGCIGLTAQIKRNRNKPDGTAIKILDSSQLNSLEWKANIEFNSGLLSTIEDFQNKSKHYSKEHGRRKQSPWSNKQPHKQAFHPIWPNKHHKLNSQRKSFLPAKPSPSSQTEQNQGEASTKLIQGRKQKNLSTNYDKQSTDI